MRVALVIERMDPSRGGRETSTGQIAAELVRRGCEVTILCQSGSLPGAGLSIRAVGSRGATRVGRMRNFVRAVQGQTGGGAFDIVHAMLPLPGANIYQPRGGTVPAQEEASLRRREGGRRLAATLTGPFNLHRRESLRLERQIAADERVLCLCVSRMVADEFRRFYGRIHGVRVIYNGVDVPKSAPVLREQARRQLRGQLGAGDDPVFVSIANNLALKGAAEAIEAFGLWMHKGGSSGHSRRMRAQLVFVGKRQYGDTFHRRVQALGLGSHVKFVPHTDDIFPWYAAADAVVLLSWYDPCSRVVLEATRLGIPSITTAFNGASEVLADGAGLVVRSPADVRAVAAAMAELADPAARARRAQACAKVAGQLTIQRHVDELIKAYQDVAKRNRNE
ncbi:MAG: glycosyltransferase family 4 protein [Phycisphaerae bacterium]